MRRFIRAGPFLVGFVLAIAVALTGLGGPSIAQATTPDLAVFAWIGSADAPEVELIAATGLTAENRVFDAAGTTEINLREVLTMITPVSVPGAPHATSIVLMREAGAHRTLTGYVYVNEIAVNARPPAWDGHRHAVLRA